MNPLFDALDEVYKLVLDREGEPPDDGRWVNIYQEVLHDALSHLEYATADVVSNRIMCHVEDERRKAKTKPGEIVFVFKSGARYRFVEADPK